MLCLSMTGYHNILQASSNIIFYGFDIIWWRGSCSRDFEDWSNATIPSRKVSHTQYKNRTVFFYDTKVYFDYLFRRSRETREGETKNCVNSFRQTGSVKSRRQNGQTQTSSSSRTRIHPNGASPLGLQLTAWFYVVVIFFYISF